MTELLNGLLNLHLSCPNSENYEEHSVMQALTKENNVVRRCLCCAPQWLEWTKIAEQFLEPSFYQRSVYSGDYVDL